MSSTCSFSMYKRIWLRQGGPFKSMRFLYIFVKKMKEDGQEIVVGVNFLEKRRLYPHNCYLITDRLNSFLVLARKT